MSILNVREKITVRNTEGLAYAWSRSDNTILESRVEPLEKSNTELESSVSRLSTSYQRLLEEVRELLLSFVDFTCFRHQSNSTYKRDVLHNATRNDHELITLRNGVAHGGTASATQTSIRSLAGGRTAMYSRICMAFVDRKEQGLAENNLLILETNSGRRVKKGKR